MPLYKKYFSGIDLVCCISYFQHYTRMNEMGENVNKNDCSITGSFLSF